MNGSLSVLAYNVYMRPEHVPFAGAGEGQPSRARLLPRVLRGYDALILSEVFDNSIRGQLLRALHSGGYPYRTAVVGRDRGPRQDGGVVIASRWPIEREAQIRFGRSAIGTDELADKGAAYACLSVDGRRYHIFGTHTNAATSPPSDGEMVRHEQFLRLLSFVLQSRISRSEPVLIGGDLNVDYGTREYHRMLHTLRVAAPATRLGHRYTYDPRTNDLAGGESREYLDYVLWSRGHLNPVASSLRTLRPKIRWDSDHEDLSDHYPVCGTFSFEHH